MATRVGRSGRGGRKRRGDAAARLIGADRDEIALVPNTTAGISLVAEGLDWRPGDNVVTLADEFPSNVYPWLNLASRGVETRRVPTDNGRLDLERAGRGVRRADADRLGELGRLRDRLSARRRADRRDRPRARRADVARCDSGPRRVSARRAQDADRLSGGRRAQVDARAGGGGHRVHSPRASRPAAADRRRLAQRGASARLHADRARISSRRRPATKAARRTWSGMLGFGASLELLLELGMRARLPRRFSISPIGPASGWRRLGRRSSPTAGPTIAAASSARESWRSSCRAAIRWR